MSENAPCYMFELLVSKKERDTMETREMRRAYPHFRCDTSDENGLGDSICGMYGADDADQDASREDGKDHDSLI